MAVRYAVADVVQLPRGAIVLPRLRDRRRGPWLARRRMRAIALAAAREVRWAIWLAQQAPTDQHAARWVTIAGAEAARAWRCARFSVAHGRTAG